MKKIFIAANSMIIGGIEKSLRNLLDNINLQEFEITLLLQEKKGELLNKLPSNIKIIEYKPYSDKNVVIRKIKNRLKFLKFIFSNKNQYDVSICFASYIYLPSIIVRKICKNNYMWVHSDYIQAFGKDEAYKFFKHLKYNKFKNLVFVSRRAKENYENYFSNKEQKYIVCRNLLDKREIETKSNENIDILKTTDTIFLNVSRHDEDSKRITLIIEACEKLKNDGESFKLFLIGDGPDNKKYRNLVIEKHLEDYVVFLGKKINPYPYYKFADCFVLSSKYEGDPTTIYESLTLGTPVITTKVGDVEEFVTKENGIILEQRNVKNLYLGMKSFIENSNFFNVNFDPDYCNQQIMSVIDKIFLEE